MSNLHHAPGRKAVSGQVITTVITLIVAIVALVLLWAILTRAMPAVESVVDGMVGGFKKMLCDRFGLASGICKYFIGA